MKMILKTVEDIIIPNIIVSSKQVHLQINQFDFSEYTIKNYTNTVWFVKNVNIYHELYASVNNMLIIIIYAVNKEFCQHVSNLIFVNTGSLSFKHFM